MSSQPKDAQSYQVYGFRLVSSYAFMFPLAPLAPEQGPTANYYGDGIGSRVSDSADDSLGPCPTVRFEVAAVTDHGRRPPDLTGSLEEPVFDDRRQTPAGVAGCVVYVTHDYTLMRFNDAADFYIRPGCITCKLYDERYHFAIEIWLFGTVLAYLLEQGGSPVLHASAVVVDGLAVGFLASNKGGKSSLAAAFVQADRRLLSDDLVGLRLTDASVMALPGYPQMRMWPEQAEGLVGSTVGLALVQPALKKLRVPLTRVGTGGFCSEPRPLGVLYLPERGPDERQPVTIEQIGAAEAMTQLMRHSYLAPMLSNARWMPKRFRDLARVLGQVPVRRLRYPSGLGRLPQVVAAIASDVANLGTEARAARITGSTTSR